MSSIAAYRIGADHFCPACAAELWGQHIPRYEAKSLKLIVPVRSIEIERFVCAHCKISYDVVPNWDEAAKKIMSADP